MSLSVKPNYVNPLTMMKQNKYVTPNKSITNQNDMSQVIKDLQLKRQTLENQILLLKSSSDSAAMSENLQKSIESQLEKIDSEIKSAKSEMPSLESEEESDDSNTKKNFDLYEPSRV